MEFEYVESTGRFEDHIQAHKVYQIVRCPSSVAPFADRGRFICVREWWQGLGLQTRIEDRLHGYRVVFGMENKYKGEGASWWYL